jgi:hypothetical protein
MNVKNNNMALRDVTTSIAGERIFNVTERYITSAIAIIMKMTPVALPEPNKVLNFVNSTILMMMKIDAVIITEIIAKIVFSYIFFVYIKTE